jgi:2,3-bisphosphoglycerate-independent phosphoglycerate mutase
MELLKKANHFKGPQGPVVLAILDGVGVGTCAEGDVVSRANTPTLDWLAKHALATKLKAHGTAVGMPSDADMGNSEIGHNAIGCGRVFAQGAKLVNESIENRALFNGAAWKELIENVVEHRSRLHFLGLFSDGNVHSHINHLEALLAAAKEEGVEKASVHILLDGRDVPPTSALDYVDRLESFLTELKKTATLILPSPPVVVVCKSPWTATRQTGGWLNWDGKPTSWARAENSDLPVRRLKHCARKIPVSSTRICRHLSSPATMQLWDR